MSAPARTEAQAWRDTLDRVSAATATDLPASPVDVAAILARLEAYESALAPHLLDGPVSDFLAGRLTVLTMAWADGGQRVEYGFTPADPLT